MKAITFVKIALVLVALTALLYWQDVWAWVSAKSAFELAGDILGFVLKWFFIGLFGFLAATLPHYVTPWLKLARLNGRRKLRAARRDRWHGQQVDARVKIPRMNKNEALVWMMSQMAKGNPSSRPTQRSALREGAKPEDIQLRF
jgi:hypothetical protein